MAGRCRPWRAKTTSYGYPGDPRTSSRWRIEGVGAEEGRFNPLRHTFINRAANNGAAIYLVSKWASHSDLATTLKYLYTNESYEHLEMDRMLANEKANEKVVPLDEYRKAG